MRLIDADALEELFRETIGYIAKNPKMTHSFEHMVRASAVVIEMIKDAPTIDSQAQWISVSERLPDIKEHHVSEPCIVYCENGAYGFTELEENIFGQVGWYCEREDEFHESLGKVLAWMPVPKPYQEDKDGK